MEKPLIKILLVEDDPDDVLLIKKYLEKGQWKPTQWHLESVETLQSAVEFLKEKPFDIVVLDLRLPDSEGVSTLTRIVENFPELPILVLTGFGDTGLALESLRKGAQDYLVKEKVDAQLLPRAIHYSIERKTAEMDLKFREARYRLLYEDNPSIYFTLDDRGRILSVNGYGAKVLGYRVEELTGESVLKIFPQKFHEAVQNQIKRCLENPQNVHNWEIKQIRKNGKELWVGESAQAVKDPLGNWVILMVCEDITDRKRIDYMKNEFIDTIYFELKNPLEDIYQATSNLQNGAMGELGDQQSKVLDIIGRKIHRLLRVTNELHDLTNLELGLTKLNRKKISVIPLMREVVQEFEAAALDWKVRFIMDLPSNLPNISGDRDLIKRVFHCIILNALRFAQNRVEVQGESFDLQNEKQFQDLVQEGMELPEFVDKKGRFVHILVEDDSPGLEYQEIKKMFNPPVEAFPELKEAEAAKKGRLDIAICREILELHRGHAWTWSAPGQGAHFHCLLPV